VGAVGGGETGNGCKKRGHRSPCEERLKVVQVAKAGRRAVKHTAVQVGYAGLVHEQLLVVLFRTRGHAGWVGGGGAACAWASL
jgi:hypothetical protein